MHKATWNGELIAQSDDVVVVEGNLYFPKSAVRPGLLRPSATLTTCPWKGSCSYYDLVVGGQVNADAVWFYPAPKDAAKQISDRVAFWKGVQVE
jgi:uncharacterized protein (DUF427 family)